MLLLLVQRAVVVGVAAYSETLRDSQYRLAGRAYFLRFPAFCFLSLLRQARKKGGERKWKGFWKTEESPGKGEDRMGGLADGGFEDVAWVGWTCLGGESCMGWGRVGTLWVSEWVCCKELQRGRVGCGGAHRDEWRNFFLASLREYAPGTGEFGRLKLRFR